MRDVGLIYIATNNITQKRYVGQTINFQKRISEHKRNKVKAYFGNSINKYGIDAFSFFKIEYERSTLGEWECYWIDKLNTIYPFGYNLRGGGAAPNLSEATKEKISLSTSGEKNHNYGTHLTEDHKKKIGEANSRRIRTIGLKRTEETKDKMRSSQIGKKHTEETKKKISEYMTGRRVGEKNAWFGKTHSPEAKEKIGAYHKGKPWSENRRNAQRLKDESIGGTCNA
jgi:group I intron endonuclease